MTRIEFEYLIQQLKSDDSNQVAEAAKTIQEKSTPADIPALIELLNSDDFVLREAAAWPLSDMGRVEALPNLLIALQRGFDEGFDNDGLQAAISDMAMMNKDASKAKLIDMLNGADVKLKENIEWLLEYCE